jgi:hypothetical protein
MNQLSICICCRQVFYKYQAGEFGQKKRRPEGRLDGGELRLHCFALTVRRTAARGFNRRRDWSKLGPDRRPVVREHFLSCYSAVCGLLDWCAVMHRDRARTVGPTAEVWGVRANRLSQGRLSAAFFGEVSFKVHSSEYSDSLHKCNSESHI